MNKIKNTDSSETTTQEPLPDRQQIFHVLPKDELNSHIDEYASEYFINDTTTGHLASIVESSEDAIISKSLNGIIRSWNKGGEKMFGFTAREAIGKHISMIIPDDDAENEKNIIERIKNNEVIDHYETERLKKGGVRIHVSLTVSPLKDATGRIIGISKIARDITARKISENELNIANKELLFQNNEKEKRAAELVLANTELAFQNHEKEKRAAELVLANTELAFQNQEKENRAAELVLANRELAFQNEEKEKRAAELVFANTELALQIKEKEKLAGALTIANNQLADQNQKRGKEVSDYKHALDESAIVSITDHSGIITYVNNNFCNVSQYTSEDLIGQNHRILSSNFHSKEFEFDIVNTIVAGNIWKGEVKNKARDGTMYWVDTTIVPFLDEHGIPYQYAALCADITLRKIAEEEVNILNEALEKRVIERTEELEAFSFSVSHDLRAPLRAVNGYARMFKNKYGPHFDQEAARLVNNIVDNATKMGHLIDDLLAFSRLSRRDMSTVNISVHDLVTEISRDILKEEESRNIKFDIKELFPVNADNTGMKQVWLNLISNAVKYSRFRKTANIEIGSEIKDEEIIYYIKDNGVGFDMRYVHKLFNVFQRLHSIEEFEGTGIGLAIVHRIIQKHGGRVWAESKMNEGATFYLALNKS